MNVHGNMHCIQNNEKSCYVKYIVKQEQKWNYSLQKPKMEAPTQLLFSLGVSATERSVSTGLLNKAHRPLETKTRPGKTVIGESLNTGHLHKPDQ